MRWRSTEFKALLHSGLFDAAYYLRTYPDIAKYKMHPLEHYIRFGAAEGKNPSAHFDTLWYLSENYEAQAGDVNPLYHYLIYKGRNGTGDRPSSALQRFESFDRSMRAGLLDGRRLAQSVEAVDVAMPGAPPEQAGDLPRPPLALCERIGSSTYDDFDYVGREAKQTLLRCLPADFTFAGARCLDFGCGIGRVLRRFEHEATQGEFWACDIDATSIVWCADNLSPPFRFFQLAETPVLPFESDSFDLVYAVAVFSQVHRDWSMWAMEIRRILKPGGVLFLTYNGGAAFETHFMPGQSYKAYMRGVGMHIVRPYNPWNKGGPHVVLSTEWLRKMWGAILDIDFIVPDGLGGAQSICVARKGSGPIKIKPAETIVHHVGTIQDFHPDATGQITPQFDASKPMLDSYGIESDEALRFTGWIVFRRDVPDRMMIEIDGSAVPCACEFSRSGEHQDWSETRYAFTARAEIGGFTGGRHMLAVHVQSQAGAHHTMSIHLKLCRSPVGDGEGAGKITRT